jgi:hypothetical protein
VTNPLDKHSLHGDAPHRSLLLNCDTITPECHHDDVPHQSEPINRSTCFRMESWTHPLGKHSFRHDAPHQSPTIDHPESSHQPLAKHIMSMCHRIGRRTHSLGKHLSFDDDAPHRRPPTNHNNSTDCRTYTTSGITTCTGTTIRSTPINTGSTGCGT